MDQDPLKKYREVNILGASFRRLGVENWTEQDFIEDGRRGRLVAEAQQARVAAMKARGWVLRYPYCSHDDRGAYAIDPVTQEEISHREAYARQEAREPGSVPPWPKFDNNWTPPPSTEGLFTISDTPVVRTGMPMLRRFDIIERHQQMAKEDQAVVDALDQIARSEG